MQKPNNKLYLLLTFCTLALVAVLFSMLIIFIEDNGVSVIISCLISIFGGVLASVIVSWLIDVSGCRKNNTALAMRKHKNLAYIKSTLDDLFQSFADAYSASDEESNGNWEYWLCRLSKQDFFRDSPDFHKKLLGVYVNSNSLIQYLDEADSGSLKEFYLDTAQEVLSELQLLSDSVKRLQRVIFLNKDENLDHIIFCINDVLLTVLCLYELHDKKYTSKTDCIESCTDDT